MRGKDLGHFFTCSYFGITPAYAGKRPDSLRKQGEQRDHPRLCGEKCGAYSAEKMAAGSPPPMRGKDFLESNSGCICRITPAYAGKSLLRSIRAFTDKDHPRLCGEKMITLMHLISPHGITPAYAGKSARSPSAFLASSDHPRLCGEKQISATT